MSERDRLGDGGKDRKSPLVNGAGGTKPPANYGRATYVGAASRPATTEKVGDFPIGAGFADHVWKVMDDAGNLLLQKHKDYGPLNISRSPGGPINGLRVRLWDKMARINHLVDSGATPENESLMDSFVDLLNYSAIAIMVLEGTWPKGEQS